MLDDVKTFLKAGLDSLSPGVTDRVPEAVLARAQALAEQMSSLFGGLLEWSSEARASLRQEVKDAVNRQVGDLGVATTREVDSLRARIEELERQVAGRTARPGSGTASGRASGRAKKATARAATTKKPATPKATRATGSGASRRSPGSAHGTR